MLHGKKTSAERTRRFLYRKSDPVPRGSRSHHHRFLQDAGRSSLRDPLIPDGEILAAVSADLIPGIVILIPHTVRKTQVSGENIIFPGFYAVSDSKVAYTLISIIRPENRSAVVDGFPVETIAADAEINLFAVRCCFFPKMNK